MKAVFVLSVEVFLLLLNQKMMMKMPIKAIQSVKSWEAYQKERRGNRYLESLREQNKILEMDLDREIEISNQKIKSFENLI